MIRGSVALPAGVFQGGGTVELHLTQAAKPGRQDRRHDRAVRRLEEAHHDADRDKSERLAHEEGERRRHHGGAGDQPRGAGGVRPRQRLELDDLRVARGRGCGARASTGGAPPRVGPSARAARRPDRGRACRGRRRARRTRSRPARAPPRRDSAGRRGRAARTGGGACSPLARRRSSRVRSWWGSHGPCSGQVPEPAGRMHTGQRCPPRAGVPIRPPPGRGRGRGRARRAARRSGRRSSPRPCGGCRRRSTARGRCGASGSRRIRPTRTSSVADGVGGERILGGGGVVDDPDAGCRLQDLARRRPPRAASASRSRPPRSGRARRARGRTSRGSRLASSPGSCASRERAWSPPACCPPSKTSHCGIALNAIGCGYTTGSAGSSVEHGLRSALRSSSTALAPVPDDRLVGRDGDVRPGRPRRAAASAPPRAGSWSSSGSRRCRGGPAAVSAFTSGTTSGTAGSMRNALDLSTTTQPRATASGANAPRRRAARREERQVETVERVGGQLAHLELGAGERHPRAGGAGRRERHDLGGREAALVRAPRARSARRRRSHRRRRLEA